MLRLPLRILLTSSICLLSVSSRAADTPPSPDELFSLKGDVDVNSLETKGCTVSLSEEGGRRALKAEFSPDVIKYPYVRFQPPGGFWNLSAFGGVQVEVTNVGPIKTKAALRVDNEGDFRKTPWSVEAVPLAPGETKTIQVNFGVAYGGKQPSYPLDPSKICRIVVFVNQPTENVTLLVRDLKPFGSPTTTAGN